MGIRGLSKGVKALGPGGGGPWKALRLAYGQERVESGLCLGSLLEQVLLQEGSGPLSCYKAQRTLLTLDQCQLDE